MKRNGILALFVLAVLTALSIFAAPLSFTATPIGQKNTGLPRGQQQHRRRNLGQQIHESRLNKTLQRGIGADLDGLHGQTIT